MTNETFNSNSIIDAVKRLERVGTEHGKATEKLKKSCQQVADYLIQHVPADIWFGAFVPGHVTPAKKERTYQVVYHRGWERDLYDGYELHSRGERIARDGEGYWNQWTRDSALLFAKEVAAGLLDEAIEAIQEEADRLAAASAEVEREAARQIIEAN